MRKLLLLSAFIITCFASAQVPQGISYQAIALNSSGNPVISGNVGLRLSILDGAATGTSVYSETHVKTTNPQGLFNLVIGQGSATGGSFPGINWGSGSKFLKVEMDVAGGTNYVLVGTTQLLSVPYAMAAKSLVLAPGQGITLTSPNGTPYVVSVNDAGELSLPTSNTTYTFPGILYLYGSYNGYDPSTAQLMTNIGGRKFGYKYFTAGTTLKFITQNNPGGAIYGVDGGSNLILNGNAYNVIANGLYLITANQGLPDYYLTVDSLSPYIQIGFTNILGSYNVSTNTLSFTANGVTTSAPTFQFHLGLSESFGDDLADGSIDISGTAISFPNVTSTPKNFRVDLILNFNGSGTYTITQIP